MKKKINHSAALPLLLAALLVFPGSAAGAVRKEGTLSAAAARSAARATAWDVARRNPLVNSVKLQGCDRRAADRLVCLAIERGSTSTLATTCRVWIRAEGANAKPKVKLNLISCKNHRVPLLRAAEAEAAMLAEVQRMGGPEDLSFGILERLSRVEIAGMGAWTRPSAADPTRTEVCRVELRAALADTEVQVRISQPLRCALPAN
jgi:hypothetical protein